MRASASFGPAQVVFVKMPLVEDLRDAEGAAAGDFLAKFRGQSDLMVELGRIVAVDLFIGNEDRFTYPRRRAG